MEAITGAGLLIVIVAIIVAFSLFVYFIPLTLWISALAARVRIGIGELIGMRLRRVPPRIILGSQINATKAGLTIALATAAVIVLQTNVDFHRGKDGRWSLRLTKSPTSEKLVEKLLGLFPGSSR